MIRWKQAGLPRAVDIDGGDGRDIIYVDFAEDPARGGAGAGVRDLRLGRAWCRLPTLGPRNVPQLDPDFLVASYEGDMVRFQDGTYDVLIGLHDENHDPLPPSEVAAVSFFGADMVQLDALTLFQLDLIG